MRAPVLCLAIISLVGIVAAQENNANWGGKHIEMTITASGAQIEFDCATGNISEKVPLTSNSYFQLKGTLTREHGGPIRKNETSNKEEAIFSGKIENGTMTLTVLVGGKNAFVQAFVLKRGQAGQIVKCR
jgi:hypothetical protein